MHIIIYMLYFFSIRFYLIFQKYLSTFLLKKHLKKIVPKFRSFANLKFLVVLTNLHI